MGNSELRFSSALICVLAACAGDPSPEPAAPTAVDGTPVEGTPYWAVNSVGDEAGSTHLWIVDRAIDTVGQRLDLPGAASARARMTDATCKTRWQRGLYDADYRKQYNGGWFDLSPSSSTAT